MPPKVTPEQSKLNFWRNQRFDGECIVWTAARTKRGYGQLTWNGQRVYAHRFALYLKLGRWPEAEACHTCDNPPCVRFDHLFEGTHWDNMQDAATKRRMAHGDRHMSVTHPELRTYGERNGQAKLTSQQVLEIRELLNEGLAMTIIAGRFGVSDSAIAMIRNGRRWSHLR